MNNTLKKVVAVITTVTCAMVMIVLPVSSATLTNSQIDSILNLLTSFGADAGTIANVQSALTGGPVIPSTPSITGCTITSFDRNLKVGMTGDDVKCLQVILNANSETVIAASGVGSAGNETTYFGSLTEGGVIKFQEKYAAEILTPLGLTAGTGYVGSSTRVKLNSMLTAGVVIPVVPVTPVDPTDPEEEPAVGNGLTVSLASSNPAAGL